MKRNTSDHLRQSGPNHEIRSECQQIRAGWSRSERQRRAGMAAVRQFALWESISQSPDIVADDRRPLAACKSEMSFG
jgi:hypothetical protein